MSKSRKMLRLAGIMSLTVALFQAVITFSPAWSFWADQEHASQKWCQEFVPSFPSEFSGRLFLQGVFSAETRCQEQNWHYPERKKPHE